MEIIRPGKTAKDVKRTSTCPSCNCKFRHTLAETKYVSDQRDGDFRWVACPQAGCRNKFSIQP
jgi:hypothetical protein